MSAKKVEAKSKGAVVRAAKLLNVVAYQKGAVVSKEIVRSRKGTISVFALDKGQGLSEHTAPFDAFVYIVDGCAAISINKKPFRLKKGDMLVLPAGKPHALKANVRFKMLLTMIRSRK